MEAQDKTLVLGAEWDQALRKRLFEVLLDLGAQVVDQGLAVGGSQEIETLEVSLDGRRIVVESETYIGLTVTGPPDILERIRSSLATD